MDKETKECIKVLTDEIKQLKKVNKQMYDALEKMSADLDFLFREIEFKK